MKKNAFTLVELLAVIAILAILVIIALPNVMGMFNEAKKNSFRTELKEIYKVAEQTWVSDSLFNTSERVYSRTIKHECVKKLDLTGRQELEYFIKINKSGNVVEYYASDGTYQYAYNGNGLLVTDINEVQQISEISDSQKIEIDCNRVAYNIPVPPDTNLLMGERNTVLEEDNFLSTNVKRKNIEKVTFTNSLAGHTANGSNCFDVSTGNNGSVLAWVTDNNSNGLYEITIGEEGNVFASSGQRLFSGMINLTNIYGMEYFNTSLVTNMSLMFNDCRNLESLDLRYFNTSNVNNMTQMIYNCKKLTSLDLSSFDTSKVIRMTYMFRFSDKLESLDLSGFDTSSLDSAAYMFAQCSSLRNIKFGTFKVKSYMESMFTSCVGLTELDLSGFDIRTVRDIDGLFAGSTNLRTIYVGDNFKMDNVLDSQEMFKNCTSLVGGAGTTYNSSYIDGTYAHIDGGTSNPGYFTRK